MADTGAHQDNWRAEIASRRDDTVAFLSYFDTTGSEQETWVRGFWDFAFHILKPSLIRALGTPHGKHALEIGYGGGRLLQAACRYFGHVTGVDIHGEQAKVAELLRGQSIDNYDLIQGDGTTLAVPDGSVDMAYSYIVLQHLPTLAKLETLLAELRRVVRPGGAVILYFGHLDHGLFTRFRHEDMETTSPHHTRDVTLRLTMPLARRLLATRGFKVLEAARAPKAPWTDQPGGQFYVVAAG